MSHDVRQPADYDEMEEGAPEGAVNAENLQKVNAEKLSRNMTSADDAGADEDDENEVPG